MKKKIIEVPIVITPEEPTEEFLSMLKGGNK